MKHLKRIGLTAAMLMALVIGFGVAPASAELRHGMPECTVSTNNLVGHFTKGGDGLAELDLYWDATHHTNCVKMVHQGVTVQQFAQTEVYIWTCQTNTAGHVCDFISDNLPYYGYDFGRYKTFAGVASVSAAGHCIYASGSITWGGHPHWITTTDGGTGSHCG